MIDFGNIWTIAQKEIRDAGRNRWFLLYAAVFSVLSLALTWLGMVGAGKYGLSGFGRTGASMINLVLLIVPLMGLTVGALSLASERERGSLLYLLAQPVTHIEVLLGKYIGMALAIMGALAFGFGFSGIFIAWRGGGPEGSVYFMLVLFALLLGLSSLSIGFLISATLKHSTAAIGTALFVWLVLVFLGDLGVMGTAVVLKLRVGAILLLALLNPLQVFKMMAIYNLSNSLEILGPAGLFALQTYGEKLPLLLIGPLIAYILLPLVGAYFIFKKKGIH